jgi:iron complex transport system substrate-binding protein
VSRVAKVPPEGRPRVYYGRGPNGLETGLVGSINLEVLETVGAINVAGAAGRGGLTTVSPEQILSWNPDVILTLERNFQDSVQKDPIWQGVRAVRERRVYHAPEVPWGWFDAPPGANRLIGIRWLIAVLYPDLAPTNLRDDTRKFYNLFYHVDVTDAQLDVLLEGTR